MSENKSETKAEAKPDKNSKKSVIRFALVVSFVCSLLVSVAAGSLKDRQDANIALDRRVNLLRAANLVEQGKKPARQEVNRLYKTHIEDTIVDSNGKILDQNDQGAPNAMNIYLYREGEKIEGYILPFNSRGLWGKIQGYLAFKDDGETVSGFSVYSHSETPGLGGEIESAWFQKNFKGKKILNSQNKFVSVGIAKGKVENLPESQKENYVDGISGATLTGKYLSEGIKSTLVKYEAVSINFRQGGLTTMDPAGKDADIKTPAPGAGGDKTQN